MSGKSDESEVARRVEVVLQLLLDGKQNHEIRHYAAQQNWETINNEPYGSKPGYDKRLAAAAKRVDNAQSEFSTIARSIGSQDMATATLGSREEIAKQEAADKQGGQRSRRYSAARPREPMRGASLQIRWLEVEHGDDQTLWTRPRREGHHARPSTAPESA